VKAKRRNRSSVLAEYRRLQREIRAIFDPFTAEHCPTCATPCCIKPTRVTPVDVALAVGLGHTFPHLGNADPFAIAIGDAGFRLSPEAVPLAMHNNMRPCEFLHRSRCTFPDDLRPFGCTTYICKPMYAHLPDETIHRLGLLIRQIEIVHGSLLAALGRSAWHEEETDTTG
jgi:hypothetical protein